jgi:hypothetical protein
MGKPRVADGRHRRHILMHITQRDRFLPPIHQLRRAVTVGRPGPPTATRLPRATTRESYLNTVERVSHARASAARADDASARASALRASMSSTRRCVSLLTHLGSDRCSTSRDTEPSDSESSTRMIAPDIDSCDVDGLTQTPASRNRVELGGDASVCERVPNRMQELNRIFDMCQAIGVASVPLELSASMQSLDRVVTP